MTNEPKSVAFRGSSLADLRAFPETARREAGYQIDKMQHGEEPNDWKPMAAIGAGVQEIRVRESERGFPGDLRREIPGGGIHFALLPEENAGDGQEDIQLARQRYSDLTKELGK